MGAHAAFVAGIGIINRARQRSTTMKLEALLIRQRCFVDINFARATGGSVCLRDAIPDWIFFHHEILDSLKHGDRAA
ncbi:hypothetical protein PQ455_13735 [Sphingomonas naphthae]|uniref:Uncharacterized protein n=1 Tax=Sphingomonas naphthae TaxID=1813468 RepID=A0ABY7TI02_9SPHN|nr:hypothetical protein [Sphingomonas naphthae]WCT72688.1 hypothetical protein PQ455_13735 [Sphingomonas naphthae]